LILHDQHYLTCDKSLLTFLKQKGKLSLLEMAKEKQPMIAMRCMVIRQKTRITEKASPKYIHITVITQCTSLDQLTHLQE